MNYYRFTEILIKPVSGFITTSVFTLVANPAYAVVYSLSNKTGTTEIITNPGLLAFLGLGLICLARISKKKQS